MELSNKKKIACVGLLAMSAAFAAVTLSIFQGFGDALVDASQTEYVLEFSNSKNKPTEGDVSSGSYNVETELGNLIRFEIGPGEFSESGFLTLGVGGTFGNPYVAEEENHNRISGILGITVTGDFQEGDLVLYTGFDANLGVSESNSYPLKSGTEANPDFGYSFFQIKNDGTSACSIDSVSVRYSCVVQDASVAYFTYKTNSEGTGYEITGYTGPGGEVAIPSAYKGLPVTTIGSPVFYKCTSLTSIAIPSSVTFVVGSAFEGCTSLTSVTFGEGSQLESIGYATFYNCTSLTSIVIPSSVTSVGSSAFSNCTSLRSVTFGEGSQLESIGSDAFSNCRSLTSIAIPSSVTSVGSSAFDDCSILTSVTFGEGSQLESIGSYAFSGCTSLEDIVIPSSVTSVGNQAFRNCRSLKSITIPSSVTSIGNQAFQNCTSLTIYCEAESQPEGWDANWNYSDRPVYWAGEWSYVDGVPTPNA